MTSQLVCLLYVIISFHLHEIHAVVANGCSKITVGPDTDQYTFDDLEEALDWTSNSTGSNSYNSTPCFNITVAPGNYSLLRSYNICSNFILQGGRSSLEGPVVISAHSLTHPHFILFFKAADYVEIAGIQFEHSPGIIGFENITRVSIKDSSFRWFSQGAIDIYQCSEINITDSNFEHNSALDRIERRRYQGHSGGVSIGFNDDGNNITDDDGNNITDDDGNNITDDDGNNITERGFIFIDNCQFTDNTNDPLITPLFADVLQDFNFIGRGGGLVVTINSLGDFDFTIQNCLLENNNAKSVGGGIYLAFSAHRAHKAVVRNVTLRNNTSPVAGGLVLAKVGGIDEGTIRLEIYNSHFESNHARFGGGFFLYADRGSRSGELITSNEAYIVNTTFVRNSCSESGAVVTTVSQLFVVTTEQVLPLTFINCTFNENYAIGGGGVVTTTYIPLKFEGNNFFYHNKGRALTVTGTRVEVHGNLAFRGNDGIAVYITSFSQLVLFTGANISFLDNVGVSGAALVVNNMAATQLPSVFRYIPYNPLCVFRYEKPSLFPNQWEDISITFSGNFAHSGASILMSGLDFCSFPYQQQLDRVFSTWPFIHFSDNTNTVHDLDSNSSAWNVETFAVRLNVTTKEVRAYPGQWIQLKFRGLDEIGRPTTSSIRIYNDDKAGARFTPSVATSEKISTAFIRSKFLLQNVDATTVQKERSIRVESLFTELSHNDTFNITILPCPAGYMLSKNNNSQSCRCATDRNGYLNKLLDCRNSQLIIQGGLWVTAIHDKTNDLFIFPCPNDYCRCFHQNDSSSPSTRCIITYTEDAQDEQCHCEREGVLCGNCKNGTGFSALLDKCVHCNYANIGFIIALFIADALVITILLVLKVGPPAWIYPSLFYLQIMPFLTYGFPVDFGRLQPYAVYISNAFSFYFVYDFCLWPGASATATYFLRYCPFFLTIFIASVVIAFRYWKKLQRVPWYGLWWVILFQYSHIVYTSMIILSCYLLPDLENGHLSRRWFVNGNIKCFSGWHTGLAVLAIVVLILAIATIPVTILYAKDYLKKPVLLHMSIKPLSVWFKEEYPWWPAMEFLRRLILIFLTVITPLNYPVAVFLGISLILYPLLQPYRKKIHNHLEVLLTTSTLLLIIIRNTGDFIAKNTHYHRGNTGDFIANNTHHQKGKEDHHDEEDCEHVHRITQTSWQILLFFYFPIGVFLISLLIAVIIQVKKFYQDRRRKKSTVDLEQDSGISYRMAMTDRTTTNAFVSLPRNMVPLSTMMRELNREDTDESLPDEKDSTNPVTRYRKRHTKTHKTSKNSKRRSNHPTWRGYTDYVKQKFRSRSTARSFGSWESNDMNTATSTNTDHVISDSM